MNFVCAIRPTVAICSARIAAPPLGIITCWSQPRSAMVFPRSAISARRRRRSSKADWLTPAPAPAKPAPPLLRRLRQAYGSLEEHISASLIYVPLVSRRLDGGDEGAEVPALPAPERE